MYVIFPVISVDWDCVRRWSWIPVCGSFDSRDISPHSQLTLQQLCGGGTPNMVLPIHLHPHYPLYITALHHPSTSTLWKHPPSFELIEEPPWKWHHILHRSNEFVHLQDQKDGTGSLCPSADSQVVKVIEPDRKQVAPPTRHWRLAYPVSAYSLCLFWWLEANCLWFLYVSVCGQKGHGQIFILF